MKINLTGDIAAIGNGVVEKLNELIVENFEGL
ncbi:MAG: hypothetical protein K0S41_1482 [Anaerocolumna sp.]|jgi:hypothetical protein|nr:hypothetical protein [Anaerocolumna sp.]